MPDFIYHYTDIETLALILQNRTIRFNRLDKVDDISEGDSFEKIDLQKFLFVSCWTHDQNESIPQWHMYTRNMSGVRIKLPKDFFKKYEVEFTDDLEFLGPKIKNSPIPLEKLASEEHFVFTNFSERSNFAGAVDYKENHAELKNELIDINTDNHAFEMRISSILNIGSIKSPDWEFQKEYRFVLLIVPILEHPQMNWQGRFHSSIKYCFRNGRAPDFDFFDVEINKEVLNSIEITAGPLCTRGQKIIVQSLLDRYTKGGEMKESKLTGTIRGKK